jgi:hypothetical protein
MMQSLPLILIAVASVVGYLAIAVGSVCLAAQSEYQLERRYEAATIFWLWPVWAVMIIAWSPVFLYDYIRGEN